jgi:ADP-ribosylglycohydrolase
MEGFMNSISNTANGLLMGGILGDYIGRPFEVHNTNQVDFKLFTEHSNCTDDTILTIATAEALISDRDYAKAYFKWGSRYPHHGYGPRFQQWIGAGPGAKPYWSCGNGSAMRVPPVAWAFQTLKEVLEEAKRSAEVTHNHPEGIQGAQAMAAGVFLARHGATNDEIRRSSSTGH